nr:hypothetical protein [Tanacetum cinerariifolium]
MMCIVIIDPQHDTNDSFVVMWMYSIISAKLVDMVIDDRTIAHGVWKRNGSLSKYKARLVANGHSQQHGIDCDETFSLVVKPTTIYIFLSVAVSQDWPIHQLDMKNAFIHGHLSSHLLILITLIMFVICRDHYMGLNKPYVHGNCNPSKTHVDIDCKLGSDGKLVRDPPLFCNLIGALQYLTFTRPDLSYVVQQVCLYMHDPRDPYFTALKHIRRYVLVTLDYGLQLHVSSTAQFIAYSDVD